MAESSHMSGRPAYAYSPMNGGIGMGMGIQSQFSGSMMGQQAEQSMGQQQPVEAFDEEAFARAFEEAAKEEQKENEPAIFPRNYRDNAYDGRFEHDQDMSMEDSAEASKTAMGLRQVNMIDELENAQTPEQARIGADLIHDPMSESQARPEHEDPDALARTAGQLLDSVRGNQSEKFQNSEFLGLMRQ